VRRAGPHHGPLSGLTFAVKDVFEIAGVAACFGNPTWLRTHPPATRTADAVRALVQAGATLLGLTLTDEMALSLTGENHHYGTPINPRCPDRVPGGSSSGSASAVAGGLVDFALGTDTGGSVRVPASHTGILGIRPTWGSVSAGGVLPLAPRFDTVGWFARDAPTLARVGSVLLVGGAENEAANDRGPSKLLVPLGMETLLDGAAVPSFRLACSALAAALDLPLAHERLGEDLPEPIEWAGTYLTLQNADIAEVHREYLEQEKPVFGSLIADRFASALRVTASEAAAAETQRARIVGACDRAVDRGAWLLVPSAPGAAPRRGSSDAHINSFTWRGLALAAAASLAGLPQVSLPLATSEECPLGLSLIGPPGSDAELLRAAALALTKVRPSHP
jgi:amidase